MFRIGVLSPVTGGFYYGVVLAGILEAISAAGGRVVLLQTLDAGSTGDDAEEPPELVAAVGWEALDGFIAIAQAAETAHLRRLRATGKPLVLVSRDADVDAARVLGDNFGGVRTAVTHLVGHGHTRIAFIGNIGQTDMGERYEAYKEGLQSHGLPLDDALFIRTEGHVEHGGRKAAAAMATAVRTQGVTAVIAATDRVALGLMEELGGHGIAVPTDLAVIGFDDVEAGWHSTPPLASVNQQMSQLGVVAGGLLIAELQGQPVHHGRHLVSSQLLPRRSCGCGSSETAAAERGAQDGHALVRTIANYLQLASVCSSDGGAQLTAADIDVEALDAVIEQALGRLYSSGPSPETLERFTETVLQLLDEQSLTHARADGDAPDVWRHCMVRTMVLLSQLQAVTGMKRSAHLSVSLLEQYDIGMGLLGQVDTDPSDLSWLRQVSVPLGCLALWDGPPSAGRLRITGVYDPAGVVSGQLPQTCDVTEFPPLALVDQANASAQEATFVIPLRGSSGDHGLLCIAGPVDPQDGTGRATYNHWAALLGVALKQQRLLEEVRRSEERYSLATAATDDGLWDWDVQQRTCYFSKRCQEMLGSDHDRATDADSGLGVRTSAPELEAWLDAVHAEDLTALGEAIRRSIFDLEPFEIEHRIRAGDDGAYRWILARGLPVGDSGGRARRIVGSLSDIHPRKQLEEQLRQGALHDAVTGLPNRRLFLERLGQAVEQAQGEEGTGFAVVFMDLDGFKVVNDTLGHPMGDRLLITIAERLLADLRSIDIAARFGGDEFAVLLQGLDHASLLTVVDRIQTRVAAPIRLADHEVSVTASVGIASSDLGYIDAEDVLRDADIAMYHAKGAKKGTASVFHPSMHTRATGRLLVQSELRTALVDQQFIVHYQPVVSLVGEQLTQFEALVRWEHPQRGTLLPGEFLPAMAETDTIVRLGQWIIDHVCAQLAVWRETYDGPVAVSVNLSHHEFWSDRLLEIVPQALQRHGLPPECLILEITEAIILTDPDAARQIITELHARGVRLHIDDFGTGRSSLAALRGFPVDALKIDRSFIQDMGGSDVQSSDLVAIIVALGRALGVEVVAEGVETSAQAELLRTLGCDTAQGWLYGRAVAGEEAGAMLRHAVHSGVARGGV